MNCKGTNETRKFQIFKLSPTWGSGDVTNENISNFFNVQYQSTLLIFKDNKEVYRSIGETTQKEIYKAIKTFI